MEETRELNDFQREFRDKTLAEIEANREQIDEEEEEIDTRRGRFMTFKCGKDYFGIAITYVDEIIGLQPVTELPETPDYIRGLINLRGKIVPLVDVRRRFGKEDIDYNDRTCVIVITVGEDTVGLIVDCIADVVKIPNDDILDPPSVNHPEGNRFVFGIGKTGDSVKFLLDPEKLIYEPVEKS